MKSKEKLMSRQTIMEFDCAKMTKKAYKLANKCVHWSTPLKRLRKLCIYSRKKTSLYGQCTSYKKAGGNFSIFLFIFSRTCNVSFMLKMYSFAYKRLTLYKKFNKFVSKEACM